MQSAELTSSLTGEHSTIVQGTFSFMVDHFGDVIDAAALFITKQEIVDFVSKLKASDTGGEEVTVTMNFNDWVVYGALLSHTSSNIPQTDSPALTKFWRLCGMTLPSS